MTKVINFWGAPGSGKSTVASQVAGFLKTMGRECEIATEVAKDLVWDNNIDTLRDQLWVFAEQHRRLYRLLDKVEIIVTDCPLPLIISYLRLPDRYTKFEDSKEWKDSIEDLILDTYRLYDNMDFLLVNDGTHSNVGRVHDESAARELEKQISKNFWIFKGDTASSLTFKKSTAFEQWMQWYEENGTEIMK